MCFQADGGTIVASGVKVVRLSEGILINLSSVDRFFFLSLGRIFLSVQTEFDVQVPFQSQNKSYVVAGIVEISFIL